MPTTIETRVRNGGANMNANHPDFGREIWYAEPTVAAGRLLKGAPCGRGYTAASALADLQDRIRRESGTDFVCVAI